jgi:predicted O-methyltransferase YrrM
MGQRNWTPERILETSGAYWATCALHAAVELDLFTRIGDQRVAAAAIAHRLDAPADAVGRLLDAAAAMGLLTKTEKGYANTEASRLYLCTDAKEYLGYIIRHHHYLTASWARLPAAVRTGEPVRLPVKAKTEKEREAFLMGMFNLAMQLAPQLVPVVDLSGCRRLLDLGGGPGTYAIHFCRQYPELTATVMDLPATRPFAEKTIRRMDMDDRVTFTSGDYLQEELPENFDAAWLSHILHGEAEENSREIIDKTFRCLNPGAKIVIHEFILDDSRDRPLFPALFSLNMLLGTEGGRAYSQGQLTDMMRSAGFVKIQRLKFTGANDSGLMQATKPG